MIPINCVRGDATRPKGTGIKYIIHCCNDIGAWGAGFVLALSKRWKEPEKQYRDWAHNREGTGKPFELGQVQIVIVEKDILVVNMIGQRDTHWSNGKPPIRYDAIEEGLNRVVKNIERNLKPSKPDTRKSPPEIVYEMNDGEVIIDLTDKAKVLKKSNKHPKDIDAWVL